MYLALVTPLVTTGVPAHCWDRHCFSPPESTGCWHLSSFGLSFLHLWVLFLYTYAGQPMTQEELRQRPRVLPLCISPFSQSPATSSHPGLSSSQALCHGLVTLLRLEAGAVPDPLSFSAFKDHCSSLPDYGLKSRCFLYLFLEGGSTETLF